MKKLLFLLALILNIFLQYTCIDSPKPVSAENGMVVSTSSYASKVGIEILKGGGNAIDAAVAVGFALAVTYPSAGNIGGGGFSLFQSLASRGLHLPVCREVWQVLSMHWKNMALFR